MTPLSRGPEQPPHQQAGSPKAPWIQPQVPRLAHSPWLGVLSEGPCRVGASAAGIGEGRGYGGGERQEAESGWETLEVQGRGVSEAPKPLHLPQLP